MKWVAKKARVKPNKNDDILQQIAKIRGIDDPDTFLNPTEDELHSPYLMKNIEDASNRIIRAIGENQKIVVSYDPDADGITATTVMLRYLGNYTENVDYIYGQRNDGHGIEEMVKVKSLDKEKDADRIKHNMENSDKIRNADLLIIIDSSSNDVEACQFIANRLETEVIILDHHAIERENPFALLVNPQQKGCDYPNKQLSGAGVVFKVLQVMEDTLGSVDVWQYIDLVAVGMYADMMRVDVLENRYLILQGLRNIKNTGLIRILKGGKVNTYGGIKADAIGFTIAPMINGVARLDDIKLAIDILLEDDDNVCKKIRLKMQKLNEKRKEMQKEIVARYSELVDESMKVIVVMDDESSKGFNGLVAQQLSDKYRRPVIVGRLHNGKLSGSFRSYNNFKFKDFLNSFDGEIDALGHQMAGGIVDFPEEDLGNLYTYIKRHMPSLDETEPVILYDLEIDANEVSEYLPFIERFNHLAGSGFPRITTRVNGITVDDRAVLGATRETVKISTLDDMELIKFRVGENYASDLDTFDVVDAVGNISMNEFYNFKTKITTRTPQVMLDDLKKV